MRDVATSETFQLERKMKARRPRAFWMQGLRAARRYAIEFKGVSNAEARTGEMSCTKRPYLYLRTMYCFLTRAIPPYGWCLVF